MVRTIVTVLTVMLLVGATDAAVNFFRLKNETGGYLNNETGPLQTTPVQPGWHSAQWMLIETGEQDFVWLKNRWKPCFLHVERGSLECTPDAQVGWHSAQWKMVGATSDGQFKLRNRWTNCFLIAQGEAVACDPNIPSNTAGTRWKFERL